METTNDVLNFLNQMQLLKIENGIQYITFINI